VRGAFGELPTLGLSLSAAIKDGKATFAEIGMDRAYTGAPSEATREEGDDLYERLVTMVVTEVTEGLAKRSS
jgi:creatinine amidohydrolase